MSYLDLLLMTCMWGQSFILTHLKIIWYRDISDIYIYIYIRIYTYSYIPPHNASCPGASAVFAPVAGWKSTTSASCNWWQPLPVQVKYLHKVQRTGCKVKRSQQRAKVGASISASRYGMQQQHATTITTTTEHADMINTARCSNHCNLREG